MLTKKLKLKMAKNYEKLIAKGSYLYIFVVYNDMKVCLN